MKHDFKTPEECTCNKFSTNCPICDGGLAYCKVCGGAEGSLTTDCPGERVNQELDEAVYAGSWDYREGEGWVLKPNPTNQTWERSARINKVRENALKCYGLRDAEDEECVCHCDMAEQCKEDTREVAAEPHTGDQGVDV